MGWGGGMNCNFLCSEHEMLSLFFWYIIIPCLSAYQSVFLSTFFSWKKYGVIPLESNRLKTDELLATIENFYTVRSKSLC